MSSNQNYIILIVPKALSHRTAEENLGVEYLSATLQKAGNDVVVLDAWLMELDNLEIMRRMREMLEKKGHPTIVGISTYVSNIREVETLIRIIRSVFSTKIVAGGFGPSFFVDKFLEIGVDIVSIGEGERTLGDLVDALHKKTDIRNVKGIAYRQDGQTVYTEKQQLIDDLDTIPFPSRDNLEYVTRRKSAVNVLTARGCNGHCSFCSVIAFQKLCIGKKWRSRSVNNIVDELEFLYRKGVRLVKIIDDSFLEEGRDEEWCRNFRDEIVKRGIKLKLRGSVVAENVTKEKVLLLKESGFYSFACGIENFSQSVLNRYGKRATVIDNIRALRAFKECGIIIQCGIILFDPYTTLSELKDNYRYLTFFPEVVMKGIFSELYAAEGSNFTNKILLDPNTGEHVLHNENYTYDIIDEKVRTVYTLLKEWQQSHSTMYDMLVDPLNAPKNISLQNLERLMLIYQQVHKYDLDVLGLILEQIEYADSSNIKKQLAKKAINLQNTFVVIEKTIKKIYEEEDLVFDGHKNNVGLSNILDSDLGGRHPAERPHG